MPRRGSTGRVRASLVDPPTVVRAVGETRPPVGVNGRPVRIRGRRDPIRSVRLRRRYRVDDAAGTRPGDRPPEALENLVHRRLAKHDDAGFTVDRAVDRRRRTVGALARLVKPRVRSLPVVTAGSVCPHAKRPRSRPGVALVPHEVVRDHAARGDDRRRAGTLVVAHDDVVFVHRAARTGRESELVVCERVVADVRQRARGLNPGAGAAHVVADDRVPSGTRHHRDPREHLVPEGVVRDQGVAGVHEVNAVAVLSERGVSDDRAVGAVEVDPVSAAGERGVRDGHPRLDSGDSHEAVAPLCGPVDAAVPDHRVGSVPQEDAARVRVDRHVVDEQPGRVDPAYAGVAVAVSEPNVGVPRLGFVSAGCRLGPLCGRLSVPRSGSRPVDRHSRDRHVRRLDRDHRAVAAAADACVLAGDRERFRDGDPFLVGSGRHDHRRVRRGRVDGGRNRRGVLADRN